MQRCIDQRLPIGHCGGLVVAIDVAISDGGNRAPEVESVLGVKYRDVGIRSCHLRKSEQAGILQQRSSRSPGELAEDRVPCSRPRHAPEASYLGLLGGTQRALLSAQVFDFVVV